MSSGRISGLGLANLYPNPNPNPNPNLVLEGGRHKQRQYLIEERTRAKLARLGGG